MLAKIVQHNDKTLIWYYNGESSSNELHYGLSTAVNKLIKEKYKLITSQSDFENDYHTMWFEK